MRWCPEHAGWVADAALDPELGICAACTVTIAAELRACRPAAIVSRLLNAPTPERIAARRAVATFNEHTRGCPLCRPPMELCTTGTRLDQAASFAAAQAIRSEVSRKEVTR